MSSCANFLKSSIGRKYIMGITGLGLSGFVLTHMLANLLLFVSPEAYNKYSYNLINSPILYPAEAGLVVLFLTHIAIAISLVRENNAARPQAYAYIPNGEKAVSLASRTMIHQGMVLLIFTVYHLITFKYGPYYSISYEGIEMRDLYRLVEEVFQSPVYVLGYIICMSLLGFHLSHGFSSAFQSLGINHPRYTPVIKKLGYAFALLIAAGFISQPLYFFLRG